MKRSIITCALLAGMSGVLFGQNTDINSVMVVGLSDKQIGLMVESPEVMVRFVDEDGAILYKEDRKQGHFAKRFDVSLLESGNYMMEIEGDKEISSFPVNVTRNSVNVSSKDKSVISKPQFKNNGLYVTLTMNTGGYAASVDIYNDKNERIHRESFSDIDSINRSFDFTKPGNGTYHVVVKYDNRVFNEIINLHQ